MSKLDVLNVYSQPISLEQAIIPKFLEEEFPQLDGLSSIKDVLEKRIQQQRELDQKLEQAKKASSLSLLNFKATGENISSQIRTLLAQKVDLSKNLEEHLNSDQSIILEVQSLLKQLNSLHVSQEYFEVLLQINDLIAAAKSEVEKSPKHALVPYNQLVEMSTQLTNSKKLSNRLTSYLNGTIDSLWKDLRDRLSTKFTASLEALNWPTPIRSPYSSSLESKLQTFKKTFLDLLLLQQPCSDNNGEEKQLFTETLIPMEILVNPLVTRFKYHFDGKKPTSRIDKPEWFFSHVLSIVRDYSDFLINEVQPLLSSAKLGMYDAKNEFIRGLLTAVESKLRRDTKKLLKNPQYLAHTVRETLEFDQALRELHFYCERDGSDWKGCVGVFTENKNTFDAWINAEKAFAEARFEEIMDEEDVWEPLYDDDFTVEEIRPTKSADKLINLLEIITERYKPLMNLAHRLRFLVEIQLHLLALYHSEISYAMDNFEKQSFAFIRADGHDEIEGLKGVRKLCYWLDSAGFVSEMVKDWGEQEFFLELWEGVNEHTEGLSTSSNEEGDEDGTIFEEIGDTYNSLCERIQKVIVRTISKEFTTALRPYRKKRTWAVLDPALMYSNSESVGIDVTEILEISPELCSPLSHLSMEINYLGQHLPRSLFVSLFKEVAAEVDDFFWNRILMAYQFSDYGCKQFALDMRVGVWGSVQRWLRKPENYFKRVKDACTLFTLDHAVLARLSVELYDYSVPSEELTQFLEKLNIFNLSILEARELLSRKIDPYEM
ncbi:hypothetical protein K493DRAFT_406540 [Basidiobolus meristosporus CBS 931.73]|uniref:RINT-1 family protein n=1 Tax=Basidiobolus meristosporus CBS 931.73 TaxID=1314790 RepID=A0A1Y1YKP3_9FUNG|nr:hypothetical protein K493DRAFT_406540 [Basidiobolus meristosporus CBS 931.73]|eukprot:ORX98575.1 hypothetical protein K493DRAFT_406540 [Basidiobolus meristosporus CBS 931.73]